MQELSLNVLDIAQNSVKAKATLIEIGVCENTEKDTMVITVKDNGCGMTDEQIKSVTDPFYTTRTTRRVGLGVPFFKMAAEMTGGSFNISSQVGKGTQVTAVFGLSHIDRMPLGDINATICSLIQCNPDIDFVYTHKRDENEFVLDTREFRTVLEGVPLSEPEVIAFISQFIDENDAAESV